MDPATCAGAVPAAWGGSVLFHEEMRQELTPDQAAKYDDMFRKGPHRHPRSEPPAEKNGPDLLKHILEGLARSGNTPLAPSPGNSIPLSPLVDKQHAE
jgi:hypothetical protein